MTKRLIVISDMHCGAIEGITPPGYQVDKNEKPHIWKIQNESWNNLRAIAKKHRDDRKSGKVKKLVVVCNGDLIQGRQHEAWINDYGEQMDMAVKALQLFDADQYIFTRGTPSHTGKEFDFENEIARRMNGVISSEQYVTVKDSQGELTFYFVHKVGRSVIPYGKFTPVARKAFNVVLKGLYGKAPMPKICVFGHVHYYAKAECEFYTAYATPALQCNSEYGTRQCEGICHWGVIGWDIEHGEVIKEHQDIILIKSARPVEVVV